jgi:hypothetical protein
MNILFFANFQTKKITFSAVFLHFLCKYAHIFERFANFQTKKMQKKSHLSNHPHHAGDRDEREEYLPFLV